MNICNFLRKKVNIFIVIAFFALLFHFLSNKTQFLKPSMVIKLSHFSPKFGVNNTRYIGNQSIESFGTVITILFHFNKSKHKSDEYEKWSEAMIKSIGAPMVAYVDDFWANKLIKLCIKQNLIGNRISFIFSYDLKF